MTPTPASVADRARRHWGVGLVGLAVAAVYAPAAAWMWDRWWASDSYYSHGILVPLVSGYLVWRRRDRIARCPLRPSVWGVPLLAFGLLAHLACALCRVHSGSAFTLLAVLTGLVLVLAGPAVLRLLAFPIAFLFFMIPLPMQTIAEVNLQLKLLATRASVGLLDNVLGLPVVMEASTLHFPGGESLLVDDVCSGLRSLVALVAFTALYAYVSKVSWPRKLVMLAAAGPLAVLANVMRITGLGLVADRFGAEAASGWVHDISGYLVFLVALALTFVLESLLMLLPRLRRRSDPGSAGLPPEPPMPGELPNRRAAVAAAAMLPVVALTYWWGAASPAIAGGAIARKAVPQAVGDPPWVSQGEGEFSRRAVQILETDDYVRRDYRRGNDAVELVIVFSRDNRKGTHPPEVCLKGDGASVQGKRTVVVPIPDLSGMRIEMNELQADHRGVSRLYLYTYKCGGTFTPSFLRQQLILAWHSLLRRSAGGALIRLSTPFHKGRIDEARRRLRGFTQVVMPHIVAKLRPDAAP